MIICHLNAVAIAQSDVVSKVWVADQGNGTYKNPILYADYSDPDVIRLGEDFYLTASSFNCTPGLPILHSRDLLNWRIINHVFLFPLFLLRRIFIFAGDLSRVAQPLS
jgi:beta-xylosidase